MNIKTVEIKARCSNPDRIRGILEGREAEFKGTDHQTDTYFTVESGRLKLREGTIEKNLIYYRRTDTSGPKLSDIHLVPVNHLQKMKALLTAALGVQVVVDKQRQIYFINNVKFHIDKVKTLEQFMEIEAIDKDGKIGETKLHEQCTYYLQLFEISKKDLVARSYADLLMDE